MDKPVLPFVETMITQACNLSCHGCTNYSDLTHKGYVKWKDGKEQIRKWLDRITIPDIGLMGGEPLVNPEVSEWIYGVRELLPEAQIRFTTNGTSLHKKMQIIDQLYEVGNCVIKIGVHVEDKTLEDTIQKIYDKYEWTPVTEFGVDRFKTGNNVRFHVKRPDVFWKTYRGEYENMMPHHSSPSDAFAICCQQTCPLLHDGKIYKCSTAGLLADTLARFDNTNIEEWKGYIDHGIAPDCSDQELKMFLDNFGKPNKICGQCPTEEDIESRIEHIKFVKRKKKR